MIPFEIVVRPLLVSGMLVSHRAGIKIVVASEQSRMEAATTIWHEVVHLLASADKSIPVKAHKEDEVEEIAKRLAAAFPEVIDWCGLSDKFPNQDDATLTNLPRIRSTP